MPEYKLYVTNKNHLNWRDFFMTFKHVAKREIPPLIFYNISILTLLFKIRIKNFNIIFRFRVLATKHVEINLDCES